ncbi:MAG: carbohydrate porin [Marinomonadaceae bacterium]
MVNVDLRKNALKLALCAGSVFLITAPKAFAVEVTPGLDLGVEYTQDLLSNVSGGSSQGSAGIGVGYLSADLDGRVWGGSENNKFSFSYQFTTGSSISDDVGDLQTLDNIEAYNTSTIYSAYFEHDFEDEGSMYRIGMQDYNEVFSAIDTAAVFVNSSFGIDPTIAQIGPSLFPITTLGAVGRWQSDSGFYITGGLFNGVSGDEDHPVGTQIKFSSANGILSTVEAGIIGGDTHPFKVAIGSWYSTTQYEDTSGTDRSNNRGYYATGELRLAGSGNSAKLNGFAQLGSAESDRNDLDGYIGAGLTLNEFSSSRPDDILGLAFASAYTSDSYRDSTSDTNGAETAIEVTYQFAVNEYVFIQPSIQYIINPGADASTDDATILSVRGQFSF